MRHASRSKPREKRAAFAGALIALAPAAGRSCLKAVRQLGQRAFVREVEVKRSHGDETVSDGFQIRAVPGGLKHRSKPEPVIMISARVLALIDPQAAIIANALANDLDALDL